MFYLTGWRAVVVTLLLVAAESFTIRWWFGGHGVGGFTPSPSTPVTLAFWGFFLSVIGWIWQGAQVAARVTLTALSWSVQALWAFARSIANAGIAIGKAVIRASREVWNVLKLTYTEVLKPAWDKFWRFIEWAKRTLHNIFEPVFQFLDKIRSWVLRIYEDYVRPVLDIIDVTRRFLRVLAAFGIEWARTLERKLAELEAKIEAPFRLVLSAINEIVNIVNRVVTADGLFQRLALIRSFERDIRYASRAMVNWRSKPLTEADYVTIRERAQHRTLERARDDMVEAVTTGGGYHRALITEMTAQWTRRLESPF